MTRPTITLAVTLSAGEVLAARASGMLPGSAMNATWQAVARLGPMDMVQARAEWEAWNAWVDAENAKKRASAEEGAEG